MFSAVLQFMTFMKEFPAVGALCAKRFLRSPRGKHCNSLKRNVRRMIVSKSKKKRFWREINAFSPQFYHKWIKIMLIRRKRKYHETCFKIYRLSSLIARSSSLIGLDIIITKLAINRKDMTQLSILSCILVCTACFDTC